MIKTQQTSMSGCRMRKIITDEEVIFFVQTPFPTVL